MPARRLADRQARRLWLLSVVMLFALGVGFLSLSPDLDQIGQAQNGDEGTPLVRLNEDNIKKATVFIMQTFESGAGPVASCVGSGTLFSADGLILTNAHLVEASDICRADRLVISLTLRVNEPPVPTYTAEILEFDRGLDLAVLRIVSYLDGRRIEAGALQLPFVELGDSDALQLDETISVFGYPEIRNNPVEAIRATVSGFTAEANFGERAWLRTVAPIPGTMSGGGAYNRSGQLVAIPTIAPARVAGAVLDCRQVYDTNGDGQIDALDACIPIGGTISALRPSRLARGLARAAALGIRLGPERASLQQPPPTEPPVFKRLFVSTGVNEAGIPINSVSGVPTGANTLYLFFDYDHMENGLVYELRATIDGRPNPLYSLPPVTWSGGRRGLWYIGATVAQGWPNGVYEFTLFIEGRQQASQRLTIGGGPRADPQFSDVVFGIQDAQGNLIGANYVIPEGNIIRARFNFQNMRPNLRWRQLWYLGDTLINAGSDGPVEWGLEEAQGVNSNASIQFEGGFFSGQYRLELYLELPEGEAWCLPRTDQGSDFANWCLSATADFIVAGGAGGANDAQAQIFSEFRFAEDQRGGLPVGIVGESITAGPEAVYIFFNWRQLAPGTPWTWRWLVDGEVLIETQTQWAAEDSSGDNYYLSLVGSPALPDATYSFEIELAGIRITDPIEVAVGLGQLPVEAFASAEGIQLSGRILDAETGQGIPGALFIVLLAEFSIEDFEWRNVQVLGRAQADEQGFFQIPSLLPRGTVEEPFLYSVLVRAEGYLPINADGIAVTTETRSPLELTVELNRDLPHIGLER